MRSLPQHEVAYFLKGCSTLHHVDVAHFLNECSTLHHVDVAHFLNECSTLHHVDVAHFLKECSTIHHVDVACCFLINKMTRPLSLSFGIQLFTPILKKAEKWEIEDKF